MGPRRVDDLVCERVEKELLVYRHPTGETHALNEAAAVVFELCDGTHPRATMAAEVSRRCGLPPDEAIVDLALADLEETIMMTSAEAQPTIFACP
jgi:hypothetical protein